ncbi:guanylate kinase [Calditrichota bacterium]
MDSNSQIKGRLIILSGPSCVGKTPLARAFAKLHPQINNALQKVILYNSRNLRPNETDGIDYNFRKRKDIEKMRKRKLFLVMKVRDDLQALDIKELLKQLHEGDVFFEGNTFIGKKLLSHPKLKDIEKLSIFLSPLSKSEMLNLKSSPANINLADFITEMMRMKLLNRAKKYNQELTSSTLENINKRAADAYEELKFAWQFDYVISNRDGEDSKNWQHITQSASDAYKALQTFTLLLIGEKPKLAEKWPENLLN